MVTTIECLAAAVLQAKYSEGNYGRNGLVDKWGRDAPMTAAETAALLISAQHQAFDALGAASLIVAINDYCTESNVAVGRLEARWHTG